MADTGPLADGREPKVCPDCLTLCSYDGWDHVHPDGLGIGSCERGQIVNGVRAIADQPGEWIGDTDPDAIVRMIAKRIEEGDL